MAKTKLLIEDTSTECTISKEDILIYATQIGIDVKTEKHLLWIAEQGLAANVPEPWLIFSDEEDRIFYYNPLTNKKSWFHPLDKKFAALVLEERIRSKSLNSVSSDYGFESKLSSLADAPPLSSSGKNSPLPPTLGKNDGGLSNRKFEFGRIENRRGTQLAPVRLNTLKMPASKSSGMSFMPKGATLSKNIRKLKEEPSFSSQVEEGVDYRDTARDDSNESLNSDEGSKYSYEETDDEGKHNHGLEPYDMIDTSQLSPMHSADESPDALDINSLVQLGTKLPDRSDNNMKENVNNKENSPALSLRKVGQPSFLKPLSQTTKKKSTNKGSKAANKVPKVKYPIESEVDYDEKIAAIHEDQSVMLEQIQKEWLAMQDEIEKQEKEKYEDILKECSKKFEEEEAKLRNENTEKISKIKEELKKRIEEEEDAAEKSLKTLKAANKEKIVEEEEKLQKELESLKSEVKKIQEKNASELAQKKQELEAEFTKEIENLKLSHESNKKNIEETHASEISNLQKLYKQKLEEMENTHKKEVDEVKNKIIESVPNNSELQEKNDNLKLEIEEKTEVYEKLLKEKEAILDEINGEKENLVKLKKETTELQTRIEELHDEVEKTENDLDLLRSEKSGLISELNILKENIKNEKCNLLNLEKKVKSSIDAHCSKSLSEIGVNTHTSDVVCRAVQASVSCTDVSSQMENIKIPLSDAMCQTTVSMIQAVFNKYCQTNSLPSTNVNNSVEVCSDKGEQNSNHVHKQIENALSGLSMKLDSRINVIEQQLRLLHENLPKPSTSQPFFSNQEFIQNQFTEVRTVPNSEKQNIPPVYSTASSVPLDHFSSNVSVSSQTKCRCELGDSSACNVLQDVKNSVYRLNDILCTSFVPLSNGSSLYQVNQPVNNYSSPFDSFYAQFRNMQEKHRLTELKHKFENEAVKATKSSSTVNDTSAFGNASYKGSVKPSYHLMHSSLYSYNIPEDPLMRARSIVLKEQARSWKEQQLMNPPVPHIFSLNSSSGSSQSSVTHFAASQNVPSSEQTFLHFDVDPETDYNMWMTRLNALQLRIRSHKMI